MQFNNLNNNFFRKEIVFFLILYASLIVSFFLGENSTGGAVKDYAASKKIIEQFSLNFLDTLYTYDSFPTRHSPVLLIIISLFDKLNFSDFSIRIIHFHFCLLLPIIFYKCLAIKFDHFDKRIFLLLSSLIFLSPTFRTLSIWPDSRLLGVTFFTLSIYFYLRFKNEKKFFFVTLNILSCSASAYLSPNFSVFSVYFFLMFFSIIGKNVKKIIFIIILNLLLSIPAFYYIFILDINFLTKSAAIGYEQGQNIIFVNIFNSILTSFSIIFFYIFPFIFLKIIKIPNFLNYKNIFISLIIVVICAINFNYNYEFSGGGIFFKLSNFLFKNNLLFFFICFISFLTILPVIYQKKINFLIFFLIIINNPQYTIYHKYFDPFLLITFFTIFEFKLDIDKIKIFKKFIFIFFYFIFFLILSNIKFLWKI